MTKQVKGSGGRDASDWGLFNRGGEMTKQEEIREGILLIQRCEDVGGCPEEYTGDDPCPECRTQKLISYLHSKKCRIEVDRELPDEVKYITPLEGILSKASYVAVEPIKEE